MIWTEQWAFMHNARCSGHNFKHRVSQQLKVHHPVYEQEHNKKYTRDQWIHQTIGYWKKTTIDHDNWITLVRNPYSRLVSWYYRRWKSSGISFEQYIRMVTQTRTDHIMWMHIPDKIGKNKCRVFHYEDMEKLEDYVGCKFTDTRMNTTNHDAFHTYYTDETREQVYSAYKDEFDMFGYSKYLKESSRAPS